MKRYKIFHDENNVPTLVEFSDSGNVVLYDEAMAEIERLNDELLCYSEAYEAIKAENDRFKATVNDTKPVAIPEPPNTKASEPGGAGMITYDNRFRVINYLHRLLSAAERFSAFSGAGGFEARDGHQGPRELKTWADMAASDFDEEYGNLHALLGRLPQRSGQMNEETIIKGDVEKMIRDWQAECSEHPALHNQGNVLLGRLYALTNGYVGR